MRASQKTPNTLRRLSLTLLGATSLFALSLPAQAQSYPDKPIRLIVPAPPGGTIDIVARTVAEGMASQLGQPVVIDNKAGGAGMIGVHEMLNAPKDGYTIMAHISGIASEIPHIVKPKYDPFRDIKPIVELSRSGLVFIGGPNYAPNTVQEVIANAKANPGKVVYASYTAGTISHTSGIEFSAKHGLTMTHVGYRGSPPALQDVIGGSVQLMFDGPATSVPLIKGGKVKAYAVTTSKRIAALPNVPTFAELGMPEQTEGGWVGLWVAPDVPAAVQAKLRDVALKAAQSQAVRDKFAGIGLDPAEATSSEDLSKSLRAAYDKQGALLKSVDFKPE